MSARTCRRLDTLAPDAYDSSQRRQGKGTAVDLRKLTISDRAKSFLCACQGLAGVVSTQPNTWYMALATVAVVAAGLVLGLSALEWGLIATAVFVVWLAELLNSALELLTDLASPEQHPLAKKAKDAAAGAVLLAVLFSLVIAALVLGPKIFLEVR